MSFFRNMMRGAASALPGSRQLLAKHRLRRRKEAYLKRLGEAEGAKLFDYLTSSHPEGSLLELRWPEFDSPLWLRAGSADVHTFEQVLVAGEYDFSIPFQPDLIVDGGANIGLFSRICAARYPGAKILAVEPEPGNAELLRKNTAAHSSIEVVEAGLWNKETRLKIVDPGADSWSFQIVETGPSGEGLPAVTVSGLLKGKEGNLVVKLDIEGAEVEVLEEGEGGWLDRTGMLILELHDHMKPGCSAALEKVLRRGSYQRSQSGENVILTRAA